MDEHIGQLQRAMRVVGLLPAKGDTMGGVVEEIIESHSVPKEPVAREPIGGNYLGGVGRKGSTFKEFFACKYRGGENALECLNQIMKMELTCLSGDFTKHQKVSYVVKMFEDEVLWWWDTFDMRHNDAML